MMIKSKITTSVIIAVIIIIVITSALKKSKINCDDIKRAEKIATQLTYIVGVLNSINKKGIA